MTTAARSVYYFGFYLYLVGITLMVIPNVLLKTLGLPETHDVWIRVAGVLVVCLGYYYHRNGAQNNTAFCKTTILTRVFVCLSFTAFVLLNYVSPLLICFGLVDLAGAVWTWQALRKQPATAGV